MGLTVTLFGDHDALDQAISEELERRGCRSHSVSVQSGWLPSASSVIVRIDTAAGASAVEGLTSADGPRVHLVATCADPAEPLGTERLRRLCEECAATHDVSLIRHPRLVTPTAETEGE